MWYMINRSSSWDLKDQIGWKTQFKQKITNKKKDPKDQSLASVKRTRKMINAILI